MKTAQVTRPPTNAAMPATATGATPERVISSGEQERGEGYRNGPGASTRPVFRAVQPHAVCPQTAAENSVAPNAMEYGASTRAAPVNARTLNRPGWMKGSRARRQCQTNAARQATDTAKTPATPGAVQPQSFTLTMAKVKAAIPAVTSSAAIRLGRGKSWPGTQGSFHQPITMAASPIGTLTMNIQRQLIVTSTPPMSGAAAGGEPADRDPVPHGASPALGRE